MEGTRDADVDAEIEEELQDMRKPASEPLFTSIKVDTPCRKSHDLLIEHQKRRIPLTSASNSQ